MYEASCGEGGHSQSKSHPHLPYKTPNLIPPKSADYSAETREYPESVGTRMLCYHGSYENDPNLLEE
jgi:hypothetical protein